MSFGIIVKSGRKGRISRENAKEFHNEKRVKELASGRHNGIKYNPGNIEAMMEIPASKIEKMIKHNVNESEMPKDGKI